MSKYNVYAPGKPMSQYQVSQAQVAYNQAMQQAAQQSAQQSAQQVMNGQLGQIYGMGNLNVAAHTTPEDEEAMRKRDYRHALDELRGECRIFVAIALVALFMVWGIYMLWAKFPSVMNTIALIVGGIILAVTAFYGTAELIFRWRKKQFDLDYATKLMTGDK